MKKFGTPIGAGPGRANEKVGFDGVGTPFGDRSRPAARTGADAPDGPVDRFWRTPRPRPLGLGRVRAPMTCRDERCSSRARPAGRGAAVRVRAPAGAGAGGAEDADGAGAEHEPLTPVTGTLTCSEIDDSGVPGGKLTLKDSERPPSSVTVTTHCCAPAGVAVTTAPTPAVAASAAPATAASFVLVDRGFSERGCMTE
jgi:hypothetical protein